MKRNSTVALIIGVLVSLFFLIQLFTLIYNIGYMKGQDDFKKEAVKVRVGVIIQDEDGSNNFHWKIP